MCKHQQSLMRNPYNLLPGLEDAQLAKPNVEGGALVAAILLLDNYYVNCTSQRGCIYFRVKILKNPNNKLAW